MSAPLGRPVLWRPMALFLLYFILSKRAGAVHSDPDTFPELKVDNGPVERAREAIHSAMSVSVSGSHINAVPSRVRGHLSDVDRGISAAKAYISSVRAAFEQQHDAMSQIASRLAGMNASTLSRIDAKSRMNHELKNTAELVHNETIAHSLSISALSSDLSTARGFLTPLETEVHQAEMALRAAKAQRINQTLSRENEIRELLREAESVQAQLSQVKKAHDRAAGQLTMMLSRVRSAEKISKIKARTAEERERILQSDIESSENTVHKMNDRIVAARAAIRASRSVVERQTTAIADLCERLRVTRTAQSAAQAEWAPHFAASARDHESAKVDLAIRERELEVAQAMAARAEAVRGANIAKSRILNAREQAASDGHNARMIRIHKALEEKQKLLQRSVAQLDTMRTERPRRQNAMAASYLASETKLDSLAARLRSQQDAIAKHAALLESRENSVHTWENRLATEWKSHNSLKEQAEALDHGLHEALAARARATRHYFRSLDAADQAASQAQVAIEEQHMYRSLLPTDKEPRSIVSRGIQVQNGSDDEAQDCSRTHADAHEHCSPKGGGTAKGGATAGHNETNSTTVPRFRSVNSNRLVAEQRETSWSRGSLPYLLLKEAVQVEKLVSMAAKQARTALTH